VKYSVFSTNESICEVEILSLLIELLPHKILWTAQVQILGPQIGFDFKLGFFKYINY